MRGKAWHTVPKGEVGREPLMCFNQPCVQIRVVAECQMTKFFFHLAAITTVTQKICFCVLTELDVPEERKVEKKSD